MSPPGRPKGEYRSAQRAGYPLDPFENDPAALRIGFIGAGRLGTALAWSFAERGLRVLAVTSMMRRGAINDESAARLREILRR